MRLLPSTTPSRIVSAVKDVTPPLLWRALRSAAGRRANPTRSYQGVTTEHDTREMHEGAFGEAFARYAPLDPHIPPDATRLRIYLAAMFAERCAALPGDFVFGGISYGVAPRVIYELVAVRADRAFHLIDPFTGSDGGTSRVRPTYNTDGEYVRRQYPERANVRLWRDYLPQCFPLEGVDRIAFAHLNTGALQAEANSLAYLYDRLSPGGVIVLDYYGFLGGQNRGPYEPVLASLGAMRYVMVTGQGILVKP